MNVTEAIDQVLERSDNIRGSPADYQDRRLRLLDYLRETVDDIWWLRDWPWKLRSGTVVVPAGDGSVPVPPDFSSFGARGGVYHLLSSGADGGRLEPVSETEILDLRERNYRTNNPNVYSVFGIDDGDTFLKLLQLPYSDSDISLVVWFVAKPPTLNEGTAVDNLRYIPEMYHQKVLIPGMRYRSRESKSDARWQNSKAEYDEAKKWMLTEEARDRNKVVRLPSFFPRGEAL